MPATKISGVILAGGKSSRMGTDKGFMQYKGSLLIQHAINYMKAYCDEIVISTQNPEYVNLGFDLIPDSIENIGPMGGIYSCFEQIKNSYMLITGCDIPEISSNILDSLCSISDKKDISYLIDKTGKIQSIPLLLSKKTLPGLSMKIESGNYKLQDFILACASNPELISHAHRIDNLPKNINFVKDLNL